MIPGMPWWQVVGCMTILLRILVFPIVIKAQQNMVRMNNHQVQNSDNQVIITSIGTYHYGRILLL